MLTAKERLLSQFSQLEPTGGASTPPEMRLFLFVLAVSIRAKDILELGFDMGYTTWVLAMTGARVVAVDNNQDYGDQKTDIVAKMREIPHVEPVIQEAESYLVGTPANSFDMIFVDDSHQEDHVKREAEKIRDILRPGGVVVFHDTIVPANGPYLDKIFSDWQRLHLPAISPYPPANNADFGMMIVRKPYP